MNETIIERAKAELAVAIRQQSPSDDRIIMGHIQTAYTLLGALGLHIHASPEGERRLNMKPKYSGLVSKAFWDRVAKIKDEKTHDLIYIAGCALQDHENRLLQMLKRAEQTDA